MSLVNKLFEFSSGALVASGIALSSFSSVYASDKYDGAFGEDACYKVHPVLPNETVWGLASDYYNHKNIWDRVKVLIEDNREVFGDGNYKKVAGKVLKPGRDKLKLRIDCPLDEKENKKGEKLNKEKRPLGNFLPVSYIDSKNNSYEFCRTFIVGIHGNTMNALAKSAGVNVGDFVSENLDNLRVRNGKKDAGFVKKGDEFSYCKSDELLAKLQENSIVENIALIPTLTSDKIWRIRTIDRDEKGGLGSPVTIASFLGIEVKQSANGRESLENIALNYDIYKKGAEIAGIDVLDMITMCKIESGCYAFAVSEGGAFGDGQNTSWIYNSRFKNNFNPFVIEDSVLDRAKYLKESIPKYGFGGALVSHYTGEEKIKDAVVLAKDQGIDFKNDPKKFFTTLKKEKNGEKLFFSPIERQYYLDFLDKKEEWVLKQPALKPENSNLRKKIIAEAVNDKRVFYIKLTDGRYQSFVLLEETLNKIGEERKNLEIAERI